jgi:hypothetical protein
MSDYRYIHLRTGTCFGGITICKTKDGQFNFAACSLKDRYVKSRGREIARGRLEKAPFCDEPLGYEEMIDVVLLNCPIKLMKAIGFKEIS